MVQMMNKRSILYKHNSEITIFSNISHVISSIAGYISYVYFLNLIIVDTIACSEFQLFTLMDSNELPI